MNIKTALLSLSIPLTLAAVATAQSTVLLSQDRFVMGEGEVVGFPLSDHDLSQRHAIDFGLFEASALGLADLAGAQGRGYADQRSYVLPERLFAHGVAYVSSWSAPGYEGIGRARSEYVVEFQVTEPVAYVACGRLTAGDNGTASIFLRQGLSTVFGYSLGGPFEERELAESGVLQPGTYTLRVYASGVTIDSFASGTYDVLLSFEPLLETYCTSSPHTAGPGAQIGSTGSASVEQDDFALTVTGAVPNSFGLFYYGTAQQNLPFGDGVRCVGGTIYRLAPQMTDGAGQATSALALGTPGNLTSGSEWNFQFWFRDAASSGAGFNLSNGLRAVICP